VLEAYFIDDFIDDITKVEDGTGEPLKLKKQVFKCVCVCVCMFVCACVYVRMLVPEVTVTLFVPL
jgi:hypothetical protein